MNGGRKVIIDCFFWSDEERVKRLERVLADYDIEADVISSDSDLLLGKVQIVKGDLLTGFELPIQKLAVITEEEIFT